MVYVLAGIVAFIVLSFAILCVIQHCCGSSKYQESPHNAEHTGYPIQFTVSTEQSLIFRTPHNNINTEAHSSETTAFLSNNIHANVKQPGYSADENGSICSEMTDRPGLVPSAPPSLNATDDEAAEAGERTSDKDEEMTLVTTATSVTKHCQDEVVALEPTAPPIVETITQPIVSPPSYAEVMNKVVK